MIFLKRYLWKKDGGKEALHKKNAAIGVIVILILSGFSIFIPKVWRTLREKDTSTLKKVPTPLMDKREVSRERPMTMGGVRPKGAAAPKKIIPKAPPMAIKYRAKQVIERPLKANAGIPMGTHVTGRLLTSIDTRTPQWAKVELPYGAKHAQNGAEIPSGTVIFGQVSYPQRGSKVFIHFSKGVLPDGREITINAQALNLKDLTPGLIGEFHSNRGGRVATTLGLHLLGGMTEVLVEKESLGRSLHPTPKANFKNALYHGVGKVANSEAERAGREVIGRRPYITIKAGTGLIVALTHALREVQR